MHVLHVMGLSRLMTESENRINSRPLLSYNEQYFFKINRFRKNKSLHMYV